jgi:RHS repeat-associated protein
MKKRGAYTVTFDAWNREVLVQDGTTNVAVQQFNGLNQKVYLVNAAGTAIHFFYNDAWQLLEEQKIATGSVINRYVWGTQYIDDLAVEGSSLTVFSVNDIRSNVVASIDSTGAVSRRMIYEKYGAPKLLSADWSTWQSFTLNQNLFTGRYYNKDVVQNDFRNRFQDPELGVFVTRDPIGIWQEPADFGNTYTFARNDVPNTVDPSGRNGRPPSRRRALDPRRAAQRLQNWGFSDAEIVLSFVESAWPGFYPRFPAMAIRQGCRCADEAWSCERICAEAEGRPELTRESSGTVVCCAGKKCPCAFGDFSGLGGEAKRECILEHEEVHIPGVDCDSRQCLHRSIPPPGYNNDNEECIAYRAQRECLQFMAENAETLEEANEITQMNILLDIPLGRHCGDTR